MVEKDNSKARPKEVKERENDPPKDTTGDADQKDAKCPSVLLNSDEWDDPPECTVISEFHKGETTAGIGPDAEDPDLEAWLDHWKLRQSQKVLSEYHQDGAPSLENLPGPTKPIEPPDSDDEEYTKEDEPVDEEQVDDTQTPERQIDPEVIKRPPDVPRPSTIDPNLAPKTRVKTPTELFPSPYAGAPYKPKKKKRKSTNAEQLHTDIKHRIERTLDISTVEFLAFTVIRALFPRRVRYSVKREGFIDMDVILYDRDVILNTNQLVFEVPELSIWRIIYAYRGKPIIEFGRGVKNNIKIYKWRLVRILFSLWWAKRFGKAKREAKEDIKVQKKLKEVEDIVETEEAEEAKKAEKGLKKSQSKKPGGLASSKSSSEEE